MVEIGMETASAVAISRDNLTIDAEFGQTDFPAATADYASK